MMHYIIKTKSTCWVIKFQIARMHMTKLWLVWHLRTVRSCGNSLKAARLLYGHL